MSEIQYLRHEEIDKNLWDACIHQACNAQVYASFGSEANPYYQFYYNNLPSFVKNLHTLKIRIHRKLLKTLNPHYHLPDIQMPSTES